MRLRNHGGDVGLGESEDDGNRLRSAEGEIEAWDTPTLRRSQRRPSCWVTAVEHRSERVGVDLARQAEQGRARAEQPAGSLAFQVVVLRPASDGIEVVALLALGQLADAQHGRTAVTTGAATATRACGASS